MNIRSQPKQRAPGATATVCHIAEIAVRAMLIEVAATPKPGLVDRRNNGAHTDMDFFTFMEGTAALAPWLYRMALRGWRHTGAPASLFATLRPIGQASETAMLRATHGVNTQRGQIFSMGLACGLAGRLARSNGAITVDKLCHAMAAATRGLCARELEKLRKAAPRRSLTAGERIFLAYGVTGVRGEIEAGLPLVRDCGVPALRAAIARGCDINDAALHALIHIMGKIVDTTVLHRHNPAIMRQVQRAARKIQRAGGVFTGAGKKLLTDLDRDFIDKNISPGGAADMLALSLACHFWEKEIAV